MTRRVKRLVVVIAVTLLAGCGEPPSSTDTSGITTATGCPPGAQQALEDSMRSFQVVLSIAASQGENLPAVQQLMGAPEPGAFRRLAAVVGALDSAVDDLPFGTRGEIESGLLEMADHLELALSSDGGAGSAEWVAFSGFANENLVRLQAGANAYLDEAGCIE